MTPACHRPALTPAHGDVFPRGQASRESAPAAFPCSFPSPAFPVEIQPFPCTRAAPLPSVIPSPLCLLAARAWLLLSGSIPVQGLLIPAFLQLEKKERTPWQPSPAATLLPGSEDGMGRQEATVGMLCVPHSSAHSRWTRWEWEWRLLSFTGTADLRVHGWPGMKFQDFPWDLGSWLAAAQDPSRIHRRGDAGSREAGCSWLGAAFSSCQQFP